MINKCVSFKGFSRTPLPVFLLLLLSLSFSLISSQTSNASSAYDANYQTVSSLSVNATSYGVTCTPTDLTESWSTYITDASKWENPSDADDPDSQMSKARESFLIAVESGFYGVSQKNSYAGSGFDERVFVFWSESEAAEAHYGSNWVRLSALDYGTDPEIVWNVEIGCGNIAEYPSGGTEPYVYTSSGYYVEASISNSNTYLAGSSASSNPGVTMIANFFFHGDVTYPTDYEGVDVVEGTLPDPDPDDPDPVVCDALDITCWFSGVVTTIADSFQGLADFIGQSFQALGSWIANLIMPENEDGSFSNIFTDMFTDFSDTMHERLGFLLFPFDFIVELADQVNVFDDNEVGTCSSNMEFLIPNLLGENDVVVNLCYVEDLPVWDVAINIVRFIWVIGLISFAQNKYFSVVKA